MTSSGSCTVCILSSYISQKRWIPGLPKLRLLSALQEKSFLPLLRAFHSYHKYNSLPMHRILYSSLLANKQEGNSGRSIATTHGSAESVVTRKYGTGNSRAILKGMC